MGPAWGWAAVGVAVAPWLAQWDRKWQRLRPAALETTILLFLLSAGVGVWVSYDRGGLHAIFPAYPVGWAKLWGLLLAALLTDVGGSADPDRATQAMALQAGSALWPLSLL